ncbi:hypothetical protein D7Z94_00970 [Ulvibacterium marinum]|uniref:Uncharacterized protein n=1 Tax=Ulvibacterium marinum TaxID=2419782 RepID=A0A3B0C8M9_9FLAO|nr:hypothetical protein D7Z94_00970 [Ulvibacterium marinum]
MDSVLWQNTFRTIHNGLKDNLFMEQFFANGQRSQALFSPKNIFLITKNLKMNRKRSNDIVSIPDHV